MFGQVASVSIAQGRDLYSSDRKGYGYVEMASSSGAPGRPTAFLVNAFQLNNSSVSVLHKLAIARTTMASTLRSSKAMETHSINMLRI